MALYESIIRSEVDGTISFGDYTLSKKTKVSDYEHGGDLYKVKTFCEITKLEKNGMFVYESVPGTAVTGLNMKDNEIIFSVQAGGDVQTTLELEPEKEYIVYIDDVSLGRMKTNLGGKLVVSIELDEGLKRTVRIDKCNTL